VARADHDGSPSSQDPHAVAPRPQTLFNALIRRGIDLRAMYRDASLQASEPGLRVVLGENASALDQVIADLQAQVHQLGGEPARRGRLGGAARRQLIEWLLPATPHRDVAWIARLAHGEAALVHAFEEGLQRATPDAARVLHRQLPRLQGIHLDMHSLARARRC
jgi:uncharacterized protein (TIGR02284 family)